jgi:hypothetical protein
MCRWHVECGQSRCEEMLRDEGMFPEERGHGAGLRVGDYAPVIPETILPPINARPGPEAEENLQKTMQPVVANSKARPVPANVQTP